ncbi:MAG: acyltransferase family protein [Terracidiphilus sp.]
MKQRIPSLDGLRAFSIAFVLLAHFGKAHWMFAYAGFGVMTFFVISGYLITSLMLREEARAGSVSVKAFYIRRAYRILPVAYLYLAVLTVVDRHTIPAHDLIFSWTYLACYLPHVPWNLAHLWSLSVEEQFYLLWPLVFVFGKSKRFAWGAVIVAPFVRLTFNHLGYYNFANSSFPAVLDSIAVGCLLALYEPELRKFEAVFRSSYSALVWIFVLAIPAVQLHLSGPILNAPIPLYNFAVAFCIRSAISVKPWALNNRVAVWLGHLSYSLYVWQMPFSNKAYGLSWPVGIAAALVAACISYYAIERPILNLRDRRWKPTPAIPSEAPAI